MLDSIESTLEALGGQSYLADPALGTSLFLALKMGKPLFLEGEPGVGKTEVAKVLSRVFETPLIRLQCYEGLDLQQAVYEWNYPRQLLAIQARPTGSDASGEVLEDIFSEPFLLKRPLLQAIDASQDKPPVLLIDELDRADEEFESFLLELLSDFQITIPEMGTLRAVHRPMTLITSNRTREVHDALKRRCIYHWIDYPSPERELEIVRLKLPEVAESLARQVVAFVQGLRRQEWVKLPGVAETLDWAEALSHLQVQRLELATVEATLGFLLKYQDDVEKVKSGVGAQLVREVLAKEEDESG